MVVFKSIIALDLETTSLPKNDHNTTKITELACVGCEIEHLKNSKTLPRVLHKLVLLFNPNKTINPTASDITELTNELLMNLEPFRKEDVEILREFISRLPSPVCLVAHNGYKFDFPILRRAMVKVNRDLQNHVYCLDSLKAFSILLPKTDSPNGTVHHKEGNIPSFESPVARKKTKSLNTLQQKNVCRELFLDDEAFSEWASNQEESLDSTSGLQRPRKVQNIRLKDIYKLYFGENFANSHRAEEDSKALLRCIARCEGFLEWMNDNAIIFNSIEPLF